MRISDEALHHLIEAHRFTGVLIQCDSILASAELIKKGLARADDDYEGPVIHPTKYGIYLLRRKKLIEKDSDDLTDAGRSIFHKF